MIRTIHERFLSQLKKPTFPGQCQMCHGALNQQRQWVCEQCEEHLPYLTSACMTCAEPLPTSGKQAQCGACLKHPPAIDRVYACFNYQYPINQWLPQFKFSRRFALADWFGEQFIRKLNHNVETGLTSYSYNGPLQLIPVPLHNQRMRERGYNQALLFACYLSKQLNLPINLNCVVRNKRTMAQSGLSLKERQRNIKQAFTLTDEPPRQAILVDDVITTGSTLNELAAKLKSAGTEYVEAWVIAHAPLG